jgi:protocatechuate 3,4-dioxygenase beta subunit
MNQRIILRRVFLGGVGAAVIGSACGGDADGNGAGAGAGGSGAGPGGGGPGGSGGAAEGGGGSAGGSGGEGGGGPLVCTPSADNILGPYYRASAPFRSDLTEAGMVGTRITVSGRVLDADCAPIAGALLDIWQADDEGDYDNDGNDDPPPGTFVLRGRLNADDSGNYQFHTIIPGHYLNGAQYRPAHLHIKVSAPGFVELTTQLYFEGDPYNDIDPWYLPELLLLLADMGDEKVSTFDFVLAAQ